MSLRSILIPAFLLLLGPVARAQDQCVLPPGEIGTPYFFDFGLGDLDPNDFDGFDEFVLQIRPQNPQALPPGLIVKQLGTIVGTPTTPGVFSFTLLYEYHIRLDEFQQDYSFPFTCSITVVNTNGPPIRVTPGGLSFSLLQGTAAATQSIVISNATAAPQQIALAPQHATSWLPNLLQNATIPPFSDRILFLTVDASQLAPSTYAATAQVSVAPSVQVPNGMTIDIPVVVNVSSSGQSIQLSQTGLLFRDAPGGGSPASQTVRISPGANAPLNFTTAVSTSNGGPWLSVSSAGGVAQPGGTNLDILVNSTNLGPGDYYGSVRITSNAADNSPQIITVVLNISPANGPIEPDVQPFGLIFVGRANGANPAPRSIRITNPSSTPVNYTSVRTFENGNNWFTITPTTSVANPNQPGQIQVQPLLAGLIPGVYRGTISIYFDESDSARNVTVLLIVLPTTSGASTRDAVGCTPTKLIPVFTLIGAGFSNPAGWPASLGLTVVDDCGDPLTTGSVIASFNNGDPPIPLTHNGDGNWTATWTPQTVRTQVSITVRAQKTSPVLSGTETLSGKLEQNPRVPTVFSGGVVSSASFAALQPAAPGGYISVFGEELADSTLVMDKLPYTTQLGSTQVLLGGRELPIKFVAGSLINAIVPYDVPPNSTQQLVVVRNGALSQPRPVVIADAQPAIFTQAISGRGAGVIVAVREGVDAFLVTPQRPTKFGDVILIYAAGLGKVTPPVPAGAPAPFDRVSPTDNPVTVTIGGIDSKVEFAGLAPGFPGVYQLNVRIPPGLTPSPDTPIIINVAGQSSPVTTIAVE